MTAARAGRLLRIAVTVVLGLAAYALFAEWAQGIDMGALR